VHALHIRTGELAACVADVASLEQHFVPELVTELLLTAPGHPQTQQQHPAPLSGALSSTGSGAASLVHRASLMVVEANLSARAIEAACMEASAVGLPIFMEPVSVAKAVRCVGVEETELMGRGGLMPHNLEGRMVDPIYDDINFLMGSLHSGACLSCLD